MRERSRQIRAGRRRLGAALVLAVIVTACGGQTPEAAPTTTTPATTTTTTTTTAPAPPGFTYRIGLLNDVTTDNFWAYLGRESEAQNGYVLGSSHMALFTVAHPQVLLVPELAEDMPSSPTRQGGVWVVEQTLRPGVRWSDGEEVTADDLVFTYEVVRDFGLGGKWSGFFVVQEDAVEDDPDTADVDESAPSRHGITNVTALDDHTVRIEFSERPSLAVWNNGIGLAPFMPEHFWEDEVEQARSRSNPAAALYALSGEGEPSAGSMIYTGREPGSFVQNTMNMDAYFTGTTYTSYADGSFRQANPERGFDEVYNGSGQGEISTQWTRGPYAGDVVYTVYPDQTAAVLALRSGKIDLILSPLGLQAGLKDQILSDPALRLVSNMSNGFRYLAFNMRKSPMKYEGFRKAIACITDKEFLRDLLQGAALPAYGLIPESNQAWANPDVERLCENLPHQERFDQAIGYLETSGFTWTTAPEWDPQNQELRAGTGTGLTDPEGSPVPELELLAPGHGYDPLRSTYATWIAQWAEDLGIPIRANMTGFTVIIDRTFALGHEALDWDMYILGWELGDPSLPVFHESFFASYQDSAAGGFNTTGYADDRVDELAAELLAATDVEQARAAVRELERILGEDVPYLALFRPEILEAHRRHLSFPITGVLDGLQHLGGLPADVDLAEQ